MGIKWIDAWQAFAKHSKSTQQMIAFFFLNQNLSVATVVPLLGRKIDMRGWGRIRPVKPSRKDPKS